MSLENFNKPRFRRQPETGPTNSETEGAKMYTLESGMDVELHWKSCEPTQDPEKATEEIPSDRAVILLPGIEVHAKNKSTDGLSRAFADASHQRTFAVTTESKERQRGAATTELNSLFEEARAISTFIKERGLKHVTLAGYSVGGNKAIDIAYLLQNDPEVKIDGVVLLASVALYDQRPIDLTKNLLNDSFVRTPTNLVQEKGAKAAFGQWLRVATDVGSQLIGNTLSSPSHAGRLMRGIKEMSRMNPRIPEITAPVILIAGEEDLVSDAKKIVPNEIAKRGRGAYLQEHLFKKSPYVRMAIAEKQSNHGLTYFRSDDVARTAIQLLRRHHRPSE